MARFLEMGANVVSLSRATTVEATEAHFDALWAILDPGL
jgi:hypothetical protein